MYNPFLDLIKNRDNAEVAQEGNAAFGLGVDPTSLPLQPGLTNAELANEQEMERMSQLAMDEASDPALVSPAPARSVSSIDKTKTKSSGSMSGPADGSTKVESLGTEDRLEKLLAERKAAMADAQAREARGQLISSLTGSFGDIVAGAKAQKTGASVKPLEIGNFKTPDLSADVDAQTKPELAHLMDSYKALQAAKIKKDDPYNKLGWAQLEESMRGREQRDRHFLQGEGRRVDQFEKNYQDKQELTPAQQKEVYQVEATVDSLDKLEGMKDYSTGPLQGRLDRAKQFLGLAPGNKAALAAQLNMIVSQYGKAISGTAIGAAEQVKIEGQLPNINDSDEQFAYKLANFRDAMNDSRLRMLDVYARGGKNVDSFAKKTDIKELRASDPNKKDSAPAAGTDSKIEGYAKQHGMTYEAAQKLLKSRGYNG